MTGPLPPSGPQIELARNAERTTEMARNAWIWIAALLLCAGSRPDAAAEDFRWSIRDGQAVLVQYAGPGGEVAVPAVVEGSSVVRIGSQAFADQVQVTRVVLPDSVVEIDEQAFAYCTGLTNLWIGRGAVRIGIWAFRGCHRLANVSVDEQNPAFSSLDGVLYDKHQTALLLYPAARKSEAFAIPAQVERIGDEAFFRSANLKSVALPINLVHIGDSAFARSGLTRLNLPFAVAHLGEGAFSDCAALVSVTMTNGLSAIGKRAFERSGLVRVEIPEGVETIGDWAFYGCDHLKEFVVPDGLVRIGHRAFLGCTALTDVKMPASLSHVGDLAFAGCSSLSAVRFAGDAPAAGIDVFDSSPNAQALYVDGTAGWTSSWGGRPTATWTPSIPSDGPRRHVPRTLP